MQNETQVSTWEAPIFITTTIRRTGQKPLVFKSQVRPGYTDKLGWTGSTRTPQSNRWTTVTIHRTSGGNYVAVIERISQWQGEESRIEGRALKGPQEVIAYLESGESRLGPASQEAIESVCKDDPAFAESFREVID